MPKLDIRDYEIPLKEPFPCFHYDFALYCECLRYVLPMPLPKYLSGISDMLDSYGKQVKKCRPKTFPEGYRVYLVDYRLNILFVALDLSGKIATCFSKYGARGCNLTDYYYGDGEQIGGIFPGEQYDATEMSDFMYQFGFLPVEELASPAALIFEGAEFIERRLLSQYHLCLLMEQFRSKNLIDWKPRIQAAKDQYLY